MRTLRKLGAAGRGANVTGMTLMTPDKSLGLTIPPSLLQRAGHVIDP